jgi:hypothetical protein
MATAQTVAIQPEQQTLIREYVKTRSIVSLDIPGLEINIGNKIPATVELHVVEVPDVTYQYVVVGGRTVLVDPATREIVYILD